MWPSMVSPDWTPSRMSLRPATRSNLPRLRGILATTPPRGLRVLVREICFQGLGEENSHLPWFIIGFRPLLSRAHGDRGPEWVLVQCPGKLLRRLRDCNSPEGWTRPLG